MYKIALLGNEDTILGFKLLGVHLFPITKKEEAIKTLNKLVKEKYAVVFITEEIARKIMDKIEELQKISLIGFTIIPSKVENKKMGLELLKRNIEKAIGTDILFGKEGE